MHALSPYEGLIESSFRVLCYNSSRNSRKLESYTNSGLRLRCHSRPLYELNMGIFHTSVILCKAATTPLPIKYVLTTIKSFQMRCYVKFYFIEYQNHQKSDSKFPKKT